MRLLEKIKNKRKATNIRQPVSFNVRVKVLTCDGYSNDIIKKNVEKSIRNSLRSSDN